MPFNHLVDGTDLKQWADRADASAVLPRLIRRLITATVTSIEQIGFPSGDAIFLGGWDGIVQVATGNEYVPDRVSVWELGRNADPKAKADSDYEKRKTDPLGQNPTDTVFIFVTPRQWGGKSEWLRARRAESFWKDVRAYDADDLTAWLETAPAVHVWLSILLGKRPDRASDLTRWWSEWAEVTAPPLSYGLVMAGRQQAADQVLQWLRGAPAAVGLQADSREEALAFLAAVIQNLPSDESSTYLSRAIVIEDRGSWLRIAFPGRPLILVPHFDDRDGAASAIKDGHHVFVPLDRSAGRLANAIDLPRLRYEPARLALSSMGVPSEKVGQLASLARRSMLSLRRRLATSPAVRTPAWAAPTEALSLLAPLLVGTWRDDLEGDRVIVERIAGHPYSEVNNIILRWERETDPPIRRTGPAWLISSKEDAWPLLAGFLDRYILERFEEVADEIYGEVNPIYDLPSEERWMGFFRRDESSRSDLCQKGIADTLALAASQSESVRLDGGFTGQELADRVVHRILSRQTLSWKMWASLSPVLPLLAEASPDEFLSALEGGLIKAAEQFSELLSDAHTGIFGGTLHTGLLWALENLAWNPEFLGRSAMVLAKLAKADPNPKSNHANRPLGSLRDIFLSWMPQTTASIDRRLRVIDGLRQREGQVAWDIMREILPARNGILMPNHRPQYREWPPDDGIRPTAAEVSKITSEIVQRMIADAGTDGSRWADLISSLTALPEAMRDIVATALADAKNFLIEGKERLRDELRDTISSHRSFSDADWAMPPPFIDRLHFIYDGIASGDAVEKNLWLFSSSPKIMGISKRNWDAWQRELAKQRQDAAEEIYSVTGLTGILRLINEAQSCEAVGASLGIAGIPMNDEETLLSTGFGLDSGPIKDCAGSYIWSRTATIGPSWAADKWTAISETWDTRQQAQFFLSLPLGGTTWALLETAHGDTQSLYWSKVRPWRLESISDVDYAVSKLKEVNKYYTAVNLIGIYTNETTLPIMAENAAEILELAYQTPPEEDILGPMFSHGIAMMLDALEKTEDIADERIAMMEWAFMPLLEYQRQPKLLFAKLNRDPKFFVELLCFVFIAEGEEQADFTDDDRNKARLALDLFEAWHSLPGINDDQTVNADALKEWVSQARSISFSSGRGDIGDEYIGHTLSFSPIGTDGQWPHEAVRDVIEDTASDKLERGIETQTINNRGATTRSLFDGGEQERQLATLYVEYASAISDFWPRTSAMLRRIAKSYGSDARREDTDTDLREDMGG